QTDAFTLIASLRWAADTEPNLAVLRRLGEELRELARDVPGTAFVDLIGAPEEEVRIELDRHAIARVGLSPLDVARQVQALDAKVAAGLVRGSESDLLIEVSGELDSLKRIRDLSVRVGEDGQLLRIGDLGQVTKTVRTPEAERAYFDGKRGVAVAARMASDRRTDRWSQAMREAVEGFGAGLPPAVAVDVIFDQNVYVEARLSGLFENLLLGVLLVIVVTFFVMGWRSALVVGISLPLTTLMVLAGMRFLGVPIHQMSVTGLIIALGLLIDNAIIMVDEVVHRLRDGASPGEAVRGSVRFLAVPLVGSTLTTVFAFMPLVLLPGPAGEFVGSIALSVILALLSSYALALTIVPTLIGLLGGGRLVRRGFWVDGISFRPLTRIYRASVSYMLRHPVLAVVFAAALPLVGFQMAGRLPEQFFPPSDRDQVRVELMLPSGASLERTTELTKVARRTLLEDDVVAGVHWAVGRDAPKFYYNMLGGQQGAANYAEALVQLTTWNEAVVHVRRLQRLLDETFPEATFLVRNLEQGPPFDAPIEMRIFGPDLDTLRELGEQARGVLARVPDVIHTRASLAGARPKLRLDVDEAALRRTGLLNRDVAAQLDASLEGASGGSWLEATEELPVRVRLAREARDDAERFATLDLIAPAAGGVVPVSALGEPTLVPEEGAITRRSGRRVNTVQAYITAGVLPSAVLAAYQQALDDADFTTPPGYRLEFGGEQAEREEAVGGLMASVALLMVLMVTVLVMAFRSFRLAGVIFAVGGLSVGLGLMSLYVFGQNFGFMAIVGTMGLVGIAINDSIAVLASIRGDPDAARGDRKAMTEVVVRSTRHVMATTLTTIAGFMPLLLDGGTFWPPLALAIAGGVAGATVLALYFLPGAYRLAYARKARRLVAVPEGAA
ncbi:MAG: efflux RND transporter permease subunit, partial [Planctomycetota bacterium]|nr:efflux RND transporter permease subunit [Planctomycetota bacterium]